MMYRCLAGDGKTHAAFNLSKPKTFCGKPPESYFSDEDPPDCPECIAVLWGRTNALIQEGRVTAYDFVPSWEV